MSIPDFSSVAQGVVDVIGDPPRPDPKPLADMATALFNKGSDLANTAIEQADRLNPEKIKEIEGLLQEVLSKIETRTNSVLGKVGEVYTAAPKLPVLDETTRLNIARLLEDVLSKIDTHAVKILDKVKDVYTAAPQLPTNPPTVDPVVTLTKIAEAINQAETILNKQNLVILTGNVEAELNVLTIPGGPGAHAKISFQITPKPQN